MLNISGANVTPHEYHGEMNPMPGTRSRPYNHNEVCIVMVCCTVSSTTIYLLVF